MDLMLLCELAIGGALTGLMYSLVALGIVLTYGLNYWLMANYEAQRLPLIYLGGGVIVLLLLGQAAVFGPATRASRVPPAVATRSV